MPTPKVTNKRSPRMRARFDSAEKTLQARPIDLYLASRLPTCRPSSSPFVSSSSRSKPVELLSSTFGPGPARSQGPRGLPNLFQGRSATNSQPDRASGPPIQDENATRDSTPH